MSDAAFRRWARLLELAPHVGPKQRGAFERACDDALRAAVTEVEALHGLGRVQRENAILHAMLRQTPAESVRQPITAIRSDAEREAAELFMLGLFESEPVRRALLATTGMGAAMRDRLLALASKGVCDAPSRQPLAGDHAPARRSLPVRDPKEGTRRPTIVQPEAAQRVSPKEKR